MQSFVRSWSVEHFIDLELVWTEICACWNQQVVEHHAPIVTAVPFWQHFAYLNLFMSIPLVRDVNFTQTLWQQPSVVRFKVASLMLQ